MPLHLETSHRNPVIHCGISTIHTAHLKTMMTHLCYVPEQYFEALAEATSSSRITGRYVVKHFVRGGFAKSDAQCWLPGTKLKSLPSSNKPAALVTFPFFSSSQQYTSFRFCNFSLPKLVGKSASPSRSCSTAFLFPIGRHIHARIFVCRTCIMQRILRLFHTPSLLFGSLLLFERIGEICFFHSDKRVKVSFRWNSKYHAWKS